MLIADAQRDSRTVYLGGFVGQLASSIVWLASAAAATFVDPVTGFWALALGGAAILPLTHAMLRIAGRLRGERPMPDQPRATTASQGMGTNIVRRWANPAVWLLDVG